MESLVDFYKNKRIFLTGHTGFKGAWLSLWLSSIGAEVCGYSLDPSTEPSLFNVLNLKNNMQSVIGDIRDFEKLSNVMNSFKPDIVFHLAAQSLVSEAYSHPKETYEVNVMGTLNTLFAALQCDTVVTFINVTTDKCYENIEKNYAYNEEDKLGGYDMYSSSKACSEILTSSFRRSFLDEGFVLASARAGNVLGGGDWAVDRLIPDCAKAFNNGMPIVLRNPNSIRPWQYVLEPLRGYLILAEKLCRQGKKLEGAYNFGPEKEYQAEEVVSKFAQYFKSVSIESQKGSYHEANLLRLDSSKALINLGWRNILTIDEIIENTALWYRNYYENSDMREFSLKQLREYTELCVERNP